MRLQTQRASPSEEFPVETLPAYAHHSSNSKPHISRLETHHFEVVTSLTYHVDLRSDPTNVLGALRSQSSSLMLCTYPD